MHRNLDKIFLCCLYAFCDSCLHFVGLTETPANDAVFVTYHNYGSKVNVRPPLSLW